MRFIGWTEVPSEIWLRQWSAQYPDDYDEDEYRALIACCDIFQAFHYERIGKWKDNAKSPARWRPNVASVAYEIWMQAAAQLPRCPADQGILTFLEEWSERRYQDQYASGTTRVKRFGLSRASTLLHFISGGHYPIFDSRVVAAVSHLLNSPMDYTVGSYMDSYCPTFQRLADACQTTDMRLLDKALFSYGSVVGQLSKVPLA